MHGPRRGTRLGTCLVYAVCVVAFVACVNGDKLSVMSLILLKSVVHDAWCGGVVGLFGRPISCCTILCPWPLDVGIFHVFCVLFRLPNVGQGYNEHYSLCNCILCAPNLPSDPVPL